MISLTYGGFLNRGTPIAGWFMKVNPTKIDGLHIFEGFLKWGYPSHHPFLDGFSTT